MPSTRRIENGYVNLKQVSEVNQNFLVHPVSDTEQAFYLWEDIQCVRVRTKRTGLFPRRNKDSASIPVGDFL